MFNGLFRYPFRTESGLVHLDGLISNLFHSTFEPALTLMDTEDNTSYFSTHACSTSYVPVYEILKHIEAHGHIEISTTTQCFHVYCVENII